MDIEILINLINKNLSQRKISKILGISQASVRYWLSKFNLKTKKIEKVQIKKCLLCGKEFENKKWRNKKFCDGDCFQNYRYNQFILKWKNGLENGLITKDKVTSPYIRRYLFKKYNNKCCKCGWHEINLITKRIPLTINHIDGNYLNNSENNLELICPNCHSLTDTYGILNKGKGRKLRQERRKKDKLKEAS